MQRKNPFTKIYASCNSSSNKKKPSDVSAFPSHIDIELTNLCNMKCCMCETGLKISRRSTGFMVGDLFSRILDEAASYNCAIRFIRWGEPSIHPEFINIIKSVHEKGLLCHINTNGLLMDENMMQELLSIPLDSIKFSFQGAHPEGYKIMRRADKFSEVRDKVKRLFELRGGAEKPYIHVSSTMTDESKEDIRAFMDDFSQFTDYVSCGWTLLDIVDVEALPEEKRQEILELKERSSVVQEHYECPEVFDKLSVNWDGKVTACCMDNNEDMIVGDLQSGDTLKSCWDSEKMNSYRRLLYKMEHDKIPLCRKCFATMPLVLSEKD